MDKDGKAVVLIAACAAKRDAVPVKLLNMLYIVDCSLEKLNALTVYGVLADIDESGHHVLIVFRTYENLPDICSERYGTGDQALLEYDAGVFITGKKPDTPVVEQYLADTQLQEERVVLEVLIAVAPVILKHAGIAGYVVDMKGRHLKLRKCAGHSVAVD